MFALADRLKKTLGELDGMPIAEFREWMAYLSVRAKREREAYESARRGG